MAYNRSTDGGASWEPVQFLKQDTDPRFLNDKNSMTADPNDSDFVYAVWDRLQDAAANTKLGPAENRVGLGFKGPIWFTRTIDVEDHPCPDPTENGSCPIRSGDFIPHVAVDRSNGNLYAVWMDLRFDGGIALVDHDNIAFSMSTNGGRSWSPAIKVNQTPTGEPNYDQQAFTPAVHVADDGTVTVTCYDFRHNTDDPDTLETDYFAVHCHSNCAVPGGWAGNETRITPASFDIRQAPYARGYFLGDYMGLASAGNDFVAAFGQAFVQDDATQYFTRLSAP